MGKSRPILIRRNRKICVYRQKERRKLNFELNVCLNKYIGLAWLGTRWWCAADADEIMIYPNAVLKFYYEIRILCLFFVSYILFFWLLLPFWYIFDDSIRGRAFFSSFYMWLFLFFMYLIAGKITKMYMIALLWCDIQRKDAVSLEWPRGCKLSCPSDLEVKTEDSHDHLQSWNYDERKSVLDASRIFLTAPSYTRNQTQYIFPWKKTQEKEKSNNNLKNSRDFSSSNINVMLFCGTFSLLLP